MPLYYTAVHRFDPECAGQRWRDYVEWSGLEQLEEVVSLDQLLCPTFFHTLTDEDWNYNVQADFKLHFFDDLDYVLRKAAGKPCQQVLAVWQSPSAAELEAFCDPCWQFCGFDLLDQYCDVSALVNCGGFERSFSNQELNLRGLLGDYQRALEVQACLAAEYPEETHAHCDVWALYRYVMGS